MHRMISEVMGANDNRPGCNSLISFYKALSFLKISLHRTAAISSS